MYQIQNGIANINGKSGKYNGKVLSRAARYGRNAASNYIGYLLGFSTSVTNMPKVPKMAQLSKDEFTYEDEIFDDSSISKKEENFPPVKFNYKYSEDGLQLYSLLASSYESMGKRTSISSDQLNAIIDGKTLKGEILDINSDGKVDIAEYSTYTLVEDALDDSKSVDVRNIDGMITQVGASRAFAFQDSKNKDLVKPILKYLYTNFDLDKAKENFLYNENNLIA